MADNKQVLVVRKDLNMRKGKMCAQAAHASLAAVLSQAQNTSRDRDFVVLPLKNDDDTLNALGVWLNGNFKKVCVSVDSEQELLDIYKKAREAGLIASLIQDSGLTEFGGVATYTTVAVGPDTEDRVNAITGHLKLL